MHSLSATGIKEGSGETPVKTTRGEGDDDDTGLELNASAALRKLAIGHEANYAKMRELLSNDLNYFLRKLPQ